jgi:hypothetical protein
MSKLIILLITITLCSCSSSNNNREAGTKSSLDHLPTWVKKPEIRGSIAAVGIAPKSRGGLQFQIPQAEADARANIASQIRTEVSRLTKNALREARINEIDDVENVFTQATKNVVKKIPLEGATRRKLWQDPKDGTLYVQMYLDGEMISKYFKKNKRVYNKALKKAKLGRERLDRAQKASKKLFKELDKELDD